MLLLQMMTKLKYVMQLRYYYDWAELAFNY